MFASDFQDYDSGVSFEGHLDDLYDPEIHRNQELHNQHLEDALHAATPEDFSFHVEQANEALHMSEYFQDCKSQAVLDQQYQQARLDSIIQPAEIADKYQRELEAIINPNASNGVL